MRTDKITNLEGIMIIAGSGIGTGILTLPYVINKIGIFGTLTAIIIAYFVSAVLYLMICEMTRNSKNSKELLGILNEHLFFGKFGKILSIIFFIVLILMILQNLIVYILCGSEILANLLSINIKLSKIIFYIISSLVILCGIKGISNGEKISVSLISLVIIILSFLSLFHIQRGITLNFGNIEKVLAVYGLFMFAFSSIFSLVQVTNYLKEKKDIKKVALTGLSINAILTIVFAYITIISSKKITTIATIGLSDTINNSFIKILCSLFVLSAMFSSYWTSGLAFTDIVENELKTKRRTAWIISTIPTIIIALLLPMSILDFIQIGAGALSIILVLVIIPAYYHAVKKEKEPLLGNIAKSKILLITISVFIIIMAISSLIPID
ncbi:MAG: aromatic amino acid transport family protein [Bacilli bacterium]|nr:aromatic amino acid transport family protein [Bacilli bacterium]